MGLRECANTIVGGGIIRGASGGEIKRACIAAQLVADPSVLFLDEPTTGLDSETSLEVMQLVRSLARKRRVAVVCSIHQPNGELFAMFDYLLVLAKGHIIYNGRANQAAQEFIDRGFTYNSAQISPAEFISSVALHFAKNCADSEHCRTRLASNMSDGLDKEGIPKTETCQDTGGPVIANPFWRCTLILLRRRFTMIRRDKYYIWSRIIREVVLASIGAIVSYDLPHSGLLNMDDRAVVLYGQCFVQSVSSAHCVPTSWCIYRWPTMV